jgi:PAS domain S-box-containing protein
MITSNILVIDDDEQIIRTFSAYLKNQNYVIHGASDYNSALDVLSDKVIDVIFADIFLDDHSGIDILREVKKRGFEIPVIMITGEPDVDTASASVRLGAFDYITKPVNRDTFIRVTKHAVQYKAFSDEKKIIELENERYRSHTEAIFKSVEDAIITVDNQMQVTHANFALENICGLPSVIGYPVSDIKNKCSLRCWNVFEEALKTNNFIREYRIECERASNPHQIVLLNVTPLKDKIDKQIGGVMTIKDITRLSRLEIELQDRNHYQNIIGKNQRMQEIYKLVDNLKDIETTVLITGPSGTGKELVAKAIHYGGTRTHKPFIAVNCSALADNLLESELFGHKKGAFTGAVMDKVGRFQMANHGSIFLDEIGDISPRIQLKLLRVLETKEIERVGDSIPAKMDVKIITATNKNLRERVKSGDFREDLYYRLKVVEINLPALRERRDDIPLLVEHYISVFNKKFNKLISGITNEVEKIFMEYYRPGH